MPRYDLGLGRFVPYFDRLCIRPSTAVASRTPRTTWYRTPGRSLTRPPRNRTTECSWSLCPSPGMYAETSEPFVRRTRATLRRAELGFLGVVVKTFVQTPRLKGEEPFTGLFLTELKYSPRAGVVPFLAFLLRPCFMS
jgi:hypothetical protein